MQNEKKKLKRGRVASRKSVTDVRDDMRGGDAMVMTECKSCKRHVWRGMDGTREALFEEARGVYRFNGGSRSGLANALRIPGVYRLHRCPVVTSNKKRKRTRWSGKSFGQ